MGQASGELLTCAWLCKERGQKLEYNFLFIIHVNFDHVWVEHYDPVTLTKRKKILRLSLIVVVLTIDNEIDSWMGKLCEVV